MTQTLEKNKQFLYLERFVNNGSPTGLTFKSSSSVPTSPMYCVDSYALPLITLQQKQATIFGGEWGKAFPAPLGTVKYPVHPDLIPRLKLNFQSQAIWEPQSVLKVTPLASPRTVATEDAMKRICCIKLDYPLELGRFSAGLSEEKLWIGPIISRYLSSPNGSKNIYFLPEIDAIETNIFQDESKSGAILRLLEVWNSKGKFEKKLDLYPAFALFGSDRLKPDTKPLICNFIQNSSDPTEKLFVSFIKPMLESYWKLSLEFGLIPEAHAQNIIFGIDPLNMQSYVIWRDFQGFFRDKERLSQPLGKMKAGKYHLISPEKNAAKYRRSFLYDWILGHYLLDPLISVAESCCEIDKNKIISNIIEITHTFLKDVGPDYLPNREWVSMSLAKPQAGEYLQMEHNKNPKYR